MQNKIFNFPQILVLNSVFQAICADKLVVCQSVLPALCFSAAALAHEVDFIQSSPATGGQSGDNSGAPKGAGAKPDPNNELMNEGDEVDGNATGSGKSGTNNKNPKAGAAAGKSITPTNNPNSVTTEQKPEWSVLLMTFTDQGHAAAATATREAMITRYPNLAEARVCSLESGSAIVYGHFLGLDDAKAKPTITMVKAIEENGVRPFARAYLVRLQTTATQAKQGPYDLSKVRARFPNVVPLFTVKVATWSDFKSGEIPLADLQRKADAYCAELRLQGFEAYVKNDADDRSSTVTIGVFDSSAYDARSTLFHPDVEKIMKKFPVLLVNGEPLFMPPPRGLPNAKPSAKPCTLIEVPR